jgi:hypothetical protein
MLFSQQLATYKQNSGEERKRLKVPICSYIFNGDNIGNSG